MKVSDLITALQKLPPDMKVLCINNCTDDIYEPLTLNIAASNVAKVQVEEIYNPNGYEWVREFLLEDIPEEDVLERVEVLLW